MVDALFESEAQKKAIVEGFSGILILFDRDMKAQWVNKATNFRYSDPIGKSCHDIFCSKNEKCASCAFQQSVQSGKIESSVQRTGIFGMDGDEVVFDITASPVKDKNGNVSGMIGIAQNVTEHYHGLRGTASHPENGGHWHPGRRGRP